MSRDTEFARDGYAVLPRLLSGRVTRSIRRTVPRLRATRAVGACERPNNTLVPLRWHDLPVATVLTSGHHLERVADATGGTDLRWTSGYLSLKDPRSGALWWHQDWWCWDHPVTKRAEAPQVALLCYLDDTNDSTGALRVLPGSHLASTGLHAVLPDVHRGGSAPDANDRSMRDAPEQATLELRAGDAVVVDYRLLHGTHPNSDERGRACLILNFAPSWNRLPDDVRAHLIQGAGLPTPDEGVAAASLSSVLPSYAGVPRDLPLVRDAPATFSLLQRQR